MCWADIVIPIVSSIIGGLLTLGGFAWTIKNNMKEKRNEDHRKVCPYLYAIRDIEALRRQQNQGSSMKYLEIGIGVNIDTRKAPLDECKFNYIFNKFYFKNISQALIIFRYLKIGNKLIELIGDQIVESKDIVEINMQAFGLIGNDETPDVKLFVTDALRKNYYFDVQVELLDEKFYCGDAKIIQKKNILCVATLTSLPKENKEILSLIE